MATEQGVVYDEFVQGAGRLDDVDITVASARWVSWDYRGKIANAVLALQVNAVDAEGTEHEEYLSCGDLKFFVPSGDGKKAVPVGSQVKLNINTNAVAFIASLMNADTRGEMAAKLRTSDDISVLDGLKLHVVQKAQPKRAGIVAAPGVASAEGKTQLIVEKVLSYPWEKAGAAPRAAAAAPAAAPKAGNGAPPVADANTELATSTLVTIVSEAGGTIKKSAIAGKVFSNPDVKAQPAPVRNALLGIIVRDDFLMSLAEIGIQYDKAAGTVSLG
jgi:hypothetical protein